MLRFPDGSQCGVIGLDEILSDVYSEGKQVNEETAEEIVDRFEAKKTIFPIRVVDSTLNSYLRSIESTLKVEPTTTDNNRTYDFAPYSLKQERHFLTSVHF